MKRALPLVVLCVIGCLFSVAHAADIKIIWTAPTACADGSALTNCPISGYEISQGSSATGTFTVKDTVASGVLTKTYTQNPGTYCYSLKTTSGTLKSDASIPVCATLTAPAPGTPGNVTLTCTIVVNGQNQPLNCTAITTP